MSRNHRKGEKERETHPWDSGFSWGTRQNYGKERKSKKGVKREGKRRWSIYK